MAEVSPPRHPRHPVDGATPTLTGDSAPDDDPGDERCGAPREDDREHGEGDCHDDSFEGSETDTQVSPL
ncbi:hypothetical protein JCM18899A_02890 [Nocardioides sp. AN3]